MKILTATPPCRPSGSRTRDEGVVKFDVVQVNRAGVVDARTRAHRLCRMAQDA
jgi:hypothetical protein